MASAECPYLWHTHQGTTTAEVTAAINACPGKLAHVGPMTARGLSTSEASQMATDMAALCASAGAYARFWRHGGTSHMSYGG